MTALCGLVMKDWELDGLKVGAIIAWTKARGCSTITSRKSCPMGKAGCGLDPTMAFSRFAKRILKPLPRVKCGKWNRCITDRVTEWQTYRRITVTRPAHCALVTGGCGFQPAPDWR